MAKYLQLAIFWYNLLVMVLCTVEFSNNNYPLQIRHQAGPLIGQGMGRHNINIQ